ncbi:MAG TPA: DUF262 domain-containing protein [Longimicrobium sp.]|nr:DUF262 domain-containing protein [Longimicrobium sp.]
MPSTPNTTGSSAVDVGFDEEEVQTWFEEEEADTEEAVKVAVSPESVAEKYARSQLRVVRETKDYTLDYLHHALQQDRYIINVAPEYQRRQRWSPKKRSQLIESFLMNIPVPPVFLFEREYNEYEVVDGRQRLDTIREFLTNSFALTGLTYWKELNRKRFNQLPTVIQRGLMRRSLPAVVLLAETKSPHEDEFDVRTVLFDRLNTGGEKLNPQELRNALYPGPFNQMLIEIARSDEFTSVWGIPARRDDEDERIPDALANNTLYKTMVDCELVLRFFAIRETLLTKGAGSLRRILDSTMRRHHSDTSQETLEFKGQFMSCIRDLIEVFDGEPFRLPHSNRPSRPLYDALMVSLSLRSVGDLIDKKAEVKNRLDEALDNPEQYDVLVGRGNTIEAIRNRVALASWILSGRNEE